MKEIGKKYNKKVVTLITDMNIPLSNSIGNRLEVEEAINVLKGEKCRLYNISKEISSILISLSKGITIEEANSLVDEVIRNKKAYNKFIEFCEAQGGDIKKMKISANQLIIKSEKSGKLKSIDALKIGELSVRLGAGKINDKENIDYNAGIKIFKDIDDVVKKGDILATLYTNKKIKLNNEDINCFIIE